MKKTWKRNNQREWYKKQKASGLCLTCHVEKMREGGIYCPQCHEIHRNRNKKDRALMKKLILDHYGQKCACCGEDNQIFLSLDHINGKGNDERRKYGKVSVVFYRYLVKHDYPKGYQILCFNCNIGREINGGICPHKM